MKGLQVAKYTTLLVLGALAVPMLGATTMRQQVAPAPPPQQSAADPGWPEPYAYIHAGELTTANEAEVLGRLPFDRIQLERADCHRRRCPVYTITLRRDGSAEYSGFENVPRLGNFTGRVDSFDYGRLCFLFESQGFENLKPDYSSSWTHQTTVFVRVWRTPDGEPMTIRDYGAFGPISLWGLQQAVDAVANRIDWTLAK